MAQDEDLITMFQYFKGVWREDGDSLFTRNHMERWRIRGTNYTRENCDWTQKENSSQLGQSAFIPISWGYGGFPNAGLKILSLAWTGCWAALPRLCFCWESLDQTFLEIPSNLVFCDYEWFWSGYCFCDDTSFMEYCLIQWCSVCLQVIIYVDALYNQNCFYL